MTAGQWEIYFSKAIDRFACDTVYLQCAEALSGQEMDIERLIEQTSPEFIVCLGAGFLSDMPVAAMVKPGRRVTLVDWLADATQQGMGRRILSQVNGQPACLFCQQCVGPEYCTSFSGTQLPNAQVCTAYIPILAPAMACANYVPNTKPEFLRWDVTAGFASDFAHGLEKICAKSRSPKDALCKAVHLCDQLSVRKPLPIASQSVDLITSSMVVSQFDIEPLGFVVALLQAAFGAEELARLIHVLQPLFDELRKKLFLAQARAHLFEIHRLLRPNGVAYFSLELFRQHELENRHFMVMQMGQVLDMINQMFSFDFALLGDEITLRRSMIGERESLIQSYVLRPYVAGKTPS
jgi:hypothetical protein